jgi:glycosyltransferase involved in cell wall biosynthesis
MLVALDAAAAANNSVGVIVAGWLKAWNEVGDAADDEVHVVASDRFIADEGLDGLPNVVLHPFGPGIVARVKAQHVTVPQLVRQLPADVLLCAVPQIPVQPVAAPIVVTSYDFRHELLPDEFSHSRRALRWLEYRRAYRRADRIATISERTRGDLARLHPTWAPKASAVLLGSDHLRQVPSRDGGVEGGGVALAYAHHTNKRPDLVIRAWAHAAAAGLALPPLTFVGAAPDLVAELRALATSLSLPPAAVTILPFVAHADYDRLLASVQVVVLASTFEGFGLPVLEGLRLRCPVVITPEPAMVEVGGPAVSVAAAQTPAALAEAVAQALAADSPATRDAGAAWADRFTWAGAVAGMRRQFELAIEARRGEDHGTG